MKTILKKNNLAHIFLGEQSVKEGTKYRLLHFCYLKEVDGAFVLYNNLTKEMVELNSDEVAFLNTLPASDITGFEWFAENWYIVPENNNDSALADQIFFLSENYKEKGFINSFVILTTTDCNARCFYCYEHGVTKNSMSPDTANDVADYIIKKSRGKEISIKWFGGEPLYNSEAMDIICDKLTANNINFFGKITTNGYLFNEENIEKAVNKWKIRYVQISLDGTEEKYNRIKNYIYKDGESPFKIVTDNIERLLKNDIRVGIRLNVSDINRENMYSLIDWLYERYAGYEKFGVYCANLFDLDGTRSEAEHKRLNEEYFKMNRLLSERGMKQNNLNKWLSLNRGCMAQNPTSVCISPKGLLGKCEHYSEGERMHGSIYSEEIDERSVNYWHQHTRIPECQTCVAYPNCSGMSNCPDMSRQCAVSERPVKYHNLDMAIDKKYTEWKKSR